eukprot:305003-Chlamydomonas_euryale.AAC.2
MWTYGCVGVWTVTFTAALMPCTPALMCSTAHVYRQALQSELLNECHCAHFQAGWWHSYLKSLPPPWRVLKL